MGTDEVSVLLLGNGILVLGGNAQELAGIFTQVMEHGKVYKVRRNNAWHTILLKQEAKILSVEIRDAGFQNTEYSSLSTDQKRLVKAAAEDGITGLLYPVRVDHPFSSVGRINYNLVREGIFLAPNSLYYIEKGARYVYSRSLHPTAPVPRPGRI